MWLLEFSGMTRAQSKYQPLSVKVNTNFCIFLCCFLFMPCKSMLMPLWAWATNLCWFGVFVVVCCFVFFKEGSSPCIWAQTQKGIRDTKKGARCWTYFLWADMYLGAGRSWDELSEVKCVVFCERIFFWKVKEKQRCVYGLIWTASCSWCHSIWI